MRSQNFPILLLGPRQVGKSTLSHSLNLGLIINLADESLFLSSAKDPQRLRREVGAQEFLETPKATGAHPRPRGPPPTVLAIPS